MQVSTRAFVISHLKYAEADLIVHCYTEDFGLKSYHLRGVRKSKKGKLRTALFQPLTLLQLEAFHKNKGTLERISEAKVIRPYQTLHSNILKSTVVLFLSEILKSAIQEEAPNAPLFNYLEESFIWLDTHDSNPNFHILFLLQLTIPLGFYPNTQHMALPYFNLLDGYFQEEPYGDYCQSGELVETLKLFFGINFDALSQIKITKTQRLEALNLLLTYYQLHLQGYKKPKSLLVLNQLFS